MLFEIGIGLVFAIGFIGAFIAGWYLSIELEEPALTLVDKIQNICYNTIDYVDIKCNSTDVSRIKIYDWKDDPINIDLPTDNIDDISYISVLVILGDEVGCIKLKDGTFIEFDACPDRNIDMVDMEYQVSGSKNILKWINYASTYGDVSYGRAKMFSKLSRFTGVVNNIIEKIDKVKEKYYEKNLF